MINHVENYDVRIYKASILSSSISRDVFLNTIEQLLQLDQLKVCIPYSRLLAGIPILAVF